MPATVIGPLWNERSYSTSVNADGLEVQSVRLPFLVKGKTRTGGMLDALSASGLPKYGDTYAALLSDGTATETDATLYVKARSIAQHENEPLLWVVTVEYSQDVWDPNRQELNPLWLPPDPRWGRERYKEALEMDLDGDPLTNSAGVPYQAVEDDGSFKTVEIARNLAAWDQAVMDEFEDLVNTDDFEVDGQTYAPYRCKVHEVTTQGRRFNGACGTYWPAKLVVHIKPVREDRPRPWDRYLLDAGLEYWDAVAGSLRPFTDSATGRPTTTPQLLAPDGSPLVGPHGGPLPPGTEPSYRQFRVCPEGSFAMLAALFVN